jgi:hypothetical protein
MCLLQGHREGDGFSGCAEHQEKAIARTVDNLTVVFLHQVAHQRFVPQDSLCRSAVAKAPF